MQKFLDDTSPNRSEKALGLMLSKLLEDSRITFDLNLQHDLKSGIFHAEGASLAGLPLKTILGTSPNQSNGDCQIYGTSKPGFEGELILIINSDPEYLFNLNSKHPSSDFLPHIPNLIAPRHPGGTAGMLRVSMDLKHVSNYESENECFAAINKSSLRIKNLDGFEDYGPDDLKLYFNAYIQ